MFFSKSTNHMYPLSVIPFFKHDSRVNVLPSIIKTDSRRQGHTEGGFGESNHPRATKCLQGEGYESYRPIGRSPEKTAATVA